MNTETAPQPKVKAVHHIEIRFTEDGSFVLKREGLRGETLSAWSEWVLKVLYFSNRMGLRELANDLPKFVRCAHELRTDGDCFVLYVTIELLDLPFTTRIP